MSKKILITGANGLVGSARGAPSYPHATKG